MGTYYRTCPDCGANLDPGEICSCRREEEQEETKTINTRTQLERER